MARIHIISYGEKQKPKKIWFWKKRKIALFLDVSGKIPLFPNRHDSVTGLDPAVSAYYECDLATTGYMADHFSEVLKWARKRTVQEAYVYVRSDGGRIRSVYVAERIKWFLTTQGIETEIHHTELMRKRLC